MEKYQKEMLPESSKRRRVVDKDETESPVGEGKARAIWNARKDHPTLVSTESISLNVVRGGPRRFTPNNLHSRNGSEIQIIPV